MEQSPFLASIQAYMYQRRYAKRTIETYLVWIRRYINFHGRQHPNAMRDSHVEAFLNNITNTCVTDNVKLTH